MLFQREDAPSHTPALKDLADALLGMPEPHDSVADAPNYLPSSLFTYLPTGRPTDRPSYRIARYINARTP